MTTTTEHQAVGRFTARAGQHRITFGLSERHGGRGRYLAAEGRAPAELSLPFGRPLT